MKFFNKKNKEPRKPYPYYKDDWRMPVGVTVDCQIVPVTDCDVNTIALFQTPNAKYETILIPKKDLQKGTLYYEMNDLDKIISFDTNEELLTLNCTTVFAELEGEKDGALRAFAKTRLIYPVDSEQKETVESCAIPLRKLPAEYYNRLYPLHGLVSDYKFDKALKNLPLLKLIRAEEETNLRKTLRSLYEDGLTLKQLNNMEPNTLNLLIEHAETVHLMVKHDMASFQMLTNLCERPLKKVLEGPNKLESQVTLLEERNSNSCFRF